MHTLLQTEFDLSGMAARMLTELLAHMVRSLEPAFPLAFGEYSTSTSLALIVALIAGAMALAGVRTVLDRKAALGTTPSSQQAVHATAVVPADFLQDYRDTAFKQAVPGSSASTRTGTVSAGAAPATTADTPMANTSARLAALVVGSLAGMAYSVILFYLALSVAVFIARLLVGVG